MGVRVKEAKGANPSITVRNFFIQLQYVIPQLTPLPPLPLYNLTAQGSWKKNETTTAATTREKNEKHCIGP